jgi:hypothetical protein
MVRGDVLRTALIARLTVPLDPIQDNTIATRHNLPPVLYRIKKRMSNFSQESQLPQKLAIIALTNWQKQRYDSGSKHF